MWRWTTVTGGSNLRLLSRIADTLVYLLHCTTYWLFPVSLAIYTHDAVSMLIVSIYEESEWLNEENSIKSISWSEVESSDWKEMIWLFWNNDSNRKCFYYWKETVSQNCYKQYLNSFLHEKYAIYVVKRGGLYLRVMQYKTTLMSLAFSAFGLSFIEENC
jgi:hypothetical protein